MTTPHATGHLISATTKRANIPSEMKVCNTHCTLPSIFIQESFSLFYSVPSYTSYFVSSLFLLPCLLFAFLTFFFSLFFLSLTYCYSFFHPLSYVLCSISCLSFAFISSRRTLFCHFSSFHLFIVHFFPLIFRYTTFH